MRGSQVSSFLADADLNIIDAPFEFFKQLLEIILLIFNDAHELQHLLILFLLLIQMFIAKL